MTNFLLLTPMTITGLLSIPPLSLLLWTPCMGAIVLALLPWQNALRIRGIAITFSLLALSQACALLWHFDTTATTLQFAELLPWNTRMGSAYALGLDGISLPMVLLATLLSTIALLASTGISTRIRGYHVWLLMLEFGMLGVFLAQDWALFYLFWEITLIPLFFLIDQWGGNGRQVASLNFVLYTMGGSIFMLIALLSIYTSGHEHSSTMAAMLRNAASLSTDQQQLIFLGFLIGFGVKMPVFPFHGWLPLAHVEAPSPVSILLSGVLLKMGAYGLLRVGAMLPGAFWNWQDGLMVMALFSILYGAMLAWRQTDLKAMIAYSSISHMGVVLLGLATLNQTGLSGAVLQMTAHGLVAGALFLLVGLLYERTHTREISDYGSLLAIAPGFAFFLTLTLLASFGIPGSAGFMAELHVLIGGFQRWGWPTAVASLGVLISATYAMRTIQQIVSGPVRTEMATFSDLRPPEYLAASTLLGLCILIGILPTPLIDFINTTISTLSARFFH